MKKLILTATLILISACAPKPIKPDLRDAKIVTLEAEIEELRDRLNTQREKIATISGAVQTGNCAKQILETDAVLDIANDYINSLDITKGGSYDTCEQISRVKTYADFYTGKPMRSRVLSADAPRAVQIACALVQNVEF